MRRILSVFGVIALVGLVAGPLAAEEKTITGEVVDVQCQMKKAENVGADHANCAMSCAKRGAKMGILASDGVYTIAGDYTSENNKKLLPYVAQVVTATGEITEQDGVKTITVAKIEKQKTTN
jgi:hypothetical protein